jgi:hypothetical protein
MPVRQLAIGGVTLAPRKFATICTFTREIFEHSIPTIESLVGFVLRDSVGAALDAALFDAVAGDATRPPGLRNGVTTITASTTTPLSEAMRKDVAALVGGVAGVANNGAIVLIASPPQAAALRLAAGPNFPYEIMASSGLAAGFVMAVAANALASAVDTTPRIDVSREALVHQEDTTPLQIAPSASPITFPVRSLWQTDSIGLRLRLEVSWGVRVAGAVAWLSGSTW